MAIAEDDARYRKALETLLGLAPGFAVLDSFSTGTALVDAARAAPARSSAWDVVLMDLDLPGIGGIDATRTLKSLQPSTRVLVLTVFEEPATVLQAIRAGADGYLTKTAPGPALMEQIRAVHTGDASLTPGVARTVLELLRTQSIAPAPTPTKLDLTEREQQVLRGLVDGASYKQIAASLSISVDTVRTYIRSLYRKLQVRSATAAVSRAVREGLV